MYSNGRWMAAQSDAEVTENNGVKHSFWNARADVKK
jgi:hypothetical protein